MADDTGAKVLLPSRLRCRTGAAPRSSSFTQTRTSSKLKRSGPKSSRKRGTSLRSSRFKNHLGRPKVTWVPRLVLKHSSSISWRRAFRVNNRVAQKSRLIPIKGSQRSVTLKRPSPVKWRKNLLTVSGRQSRRRKSHWGLTVRNP